MIVPPANIIDIASDADAGFWLAALPFAGFPVSDIQPVDHGDNRRSDSDGLAKVSAPFHPLGINPEAQRNHG